ncbi:MAG TPA: hypothetical protein VF855_09165, partial [Acidimicrobiales bacterium]
MGASALRLRSEARRHWRSFALLALVMGLAAGATLLGATSARRSDSAYQRFLQWARPSDFSTGGGPDEQIESLVAALTTAPFTEDYLRLCVVDVGVKGSEGQVFYPFQLTVIGDIDGRFAGRQMERSKTLEGREPDSSRADEAAMDFAAADRAGFRLGDRIELVRFDGQGSVFVTLVGIVASAGSFPTLNGVSNNGLAL